MFVKAMLQYNDGRKEIILNINRIISLNSLQDGYIYARADTGGVRSELCLIKPEDLVSVCNEDPVYSQITEWLVERGWEKKQEATVDEIEPDELGQICEVAFIFNRVVLTVNKGKIPASKKFGLLDNYERYEFDGRNMYFYCPGSTSPDFTIPCGDGECTSVNSPASVLNLSNPAHAVKRCRKVVKHEMAKQCMEKMIAIPNSIACDLSRNVGCSIDDFMVMKERNNEN